MRIAALAAALGCVLLGAQCTRAGFGGAPFVDLGRSDRPLHLDDRPGESLDPGGWVTVPAGSFSMGSPLTEPCRSADETQHTVTLTHAFSISTTEVTQAQFQALSGYVPSFFASCGSSCPVETLSWAEAAAYCNALSQRQGLALCYFCAGTGAATACVASPQPGGIHACSGYRLPTEAEWERAYRAGSTTAYYHATIGACAGADPPLGEIAWYEANATLSPRPVAGKSPNAWGLFDMAGNVREWCHDGYANLGSAPVTDPCEAPTGPDQVTRGGSWTDAPPALRASGRSSSQARSSTLGFRCVRSMP